MVRRGQVGRGKDYFKQSHRISPGRAWSGGARQGEVRQGLFQAVKRDMVKLGRFGHGRVRFGMAGMGKGYFEQSNPARRGKVRLG